MSYSENAAQPLLLLQFSALQVVSRRPQVASCKRRVAAYFLVQANGNATNFYGHSRASEKQKKKQKEKKRKKARDLKSETLATRIEADKARPGLYL